MIAELDINVLFDRNRAPKPALERVLRIPDAAAAH
jgi:hypothetical protein